MINNRLECPECAKRGQMPHIEWTLDELKKRYECFCCMCGEIWYIQMC